MRFHCCVIFHYVLLWPAPACLGGGRGRKNKTKQKQNKKEKEKKKIKLDVHFCFVLRSSCHNTRSAVKTVGLSEEIMFTDKYPSISSRQIEVMVYLYLRSTLYDN